MTGGPFVVVFDCMIFLQAAISETGPAAELLREAERQTISVRASREILEEVRDVLSKPRISSENPHITAQFIEDFLTRIGQTADVREHVPARFHLPRDPKDEKYINLAIAEKVNFLVSRDRDLLDLMTGYLDEAREFRQRFRYVRVITPEEFLRKIEETHEAS